MANRCEACRGNGFRFAGEYCAECGGSGFALSRKQQWEREAVRRAFERAMEQASLQAEGFPEKPFGGHLTEAMDAVLAEMEAKDEQMS